MLNTATLIFAVSFLLLWLACWGLVLRRRQPGQPLVRYEKAAPVPWGLIDLMGTLLLLFALTAVLHRWLVPAGGTTDQELVRQVCWQRLSMMIASVLTFLSAATLLKFRYRLSWHDLGLSWHAWWSDIRLGLLTFVLIGPPIYGLQIFLGWLVQPKTKHPILELLSAHPDGCIIAVSVGSAVLVAPLVEEFLFRGLLQSWLEKVAALVGSPAELLWGRGAVDDSFGKTAVPRHPQLVVYQAILISSAIFAVMHVQHGVDWVPLFFLGLVLGYLYQQTHRLLPSITVHFLLNACSMGIALLDVLMHLDA